MQLTALVIPLEFPPQIGSRFAPFHFDHSLPRLSNCPKEFCDAAWFYGRKAAGYRLENFHHRNQYFSD
jgi:hypothetical protein